ncbi:hypothetical protein TCAL_09886 [Tigriopus californicus]|uniref:C2H2-type domain-containing protein n=1 Tax=Tigriopus californicus TaxID=6832 RepID=A0A553PRS3_TIGCA|nr:hypothetical protein TCAL_09886 [Tigriopus californicus]
MSEEEAFEHAIDMIQTRQMGFRKAADFFSVSKWKLYKTARKRGIYAEIKKQNQAQALTKVPSNVQHFADMGVYKQLKKKTHLAKDNIFPHLPSTEAEVFKASTNNNFPSVVDLQQKLYPKQPDDFIEEDEVTEKSEIIGRPQLAVEDEEERVLVINHRENDASPDDDDSGHLIRKRPFSQSQLETVAQLLSVSRSAANQQALMEGHRAAQLFSPFLKGNRPTLTPLPSSTTPGFDIQASEPASPAASTGSGGSGAGSQSHGTSAGFCEICKKHVSNRTNHKYVHSQVKFRCKICGYLYSRKDTLKDHIRGKHNTKFSTQDLNQLVETVTPNANAVTNGNGTVRGSKKNQATKDTLMLNPVLVAAMIPPAPPTSGLVAAKSVETVDLPEESNDEEMEDLEGENNNNVEEGGKSVVELVKAEEQEGEEQEVVNTCGAD